MTNQEIFERNRLSLVGRNARAASALRFLPSWEGADILPSRSGSPCPALRREGRVIRLHSAFDPRTEAERLRASLPPGGYFACLGLGGGYLARELLSSPECSLLLSIEHSNDLFSFCLSRVDMSDLLSDPRHLILVDPTADDIREAVLGSYIPSISGDLSVATLRPRVDADPGLFGQDAEALRSAIKLVSDDFSVQSHFGAVWLRNTLANLEAAARPVSPLPPVRRAIVTAAGPSLEEAIPEIAERQRGGDFVIATDTSLPALVASGVRPGAVLTLDCQHISYYHFIPGYPRGVPLVMDLASPPLLARIASPVHFFSSGHPLSRYICARWRAFPRLDTSGGNVTHAALSLASLLGASEIRLYGADFSYPFGKSYARGTYIYPYFSQRASRLSPLESLFSSFLRRGGSLQREEDERGFRYLTKPLVSYRERLEGLISSLEARVVPVRGHGVAIRAEQPALQAADRQPSQLFAAGPPSSSARDFLSSYAADLEALAFPSGSPAEALMRMAPPERDLWTTVLPVAARLTSAAGGSKRWGREALEAARDWTVDRARGILRRPAG